MKKLYEEGKVEKPVFISWNETILGGKLNNNRLSSKDVVAELASVEPFESFRGYADVKGRSIEPKIDEKRLKSF